MRKHRHAVATHDAEPRAQAVGQAADAMVELGVGENPAGCEVFHGDTVAARRCVVGNPVVGRYRHGRLPGVNFCHSPSGNASPQDL